MLGSHETGIATRLGGIDDHLTKPDSEYNLESPSNCMTRQSYKIGKAISIEKQYTSTEWQLKTNLEDMEREGEIGMY